MVTVASKVAVVKSRLSELLPEGVIHDLCREAGHRWRRRVLTPAATVHLMLLQLLAHVAMIGVGRVAGVAVSAAAICKARMRLPVAVLREIADRTASWNATPGRADYCGLRVYVADGVVTAAADTPGVVKAYGRSGNGRGTGLAMPRLLALMNAFTGAITGVVDVPPGRGEQSVLTRLLGKLPAESLLLGDAGLIGFAQFAVMGQMGVHFLMRLARNKTVSGRGKGVRRRVRRLGGGDNLVRWSKPGRRPKWVNGVLWKNLPASVELRQIAVRIVRPGFRTTWAWVVTDLTDGRKYTAPSLAALYGRRYAIELAFRDLKSCLKMDRLSAQTPDGVRKQILAFVTLYNLVRRLIHDAAGRQKVPPDRISFTDAALTLLHHPPGEPMPDLRLNPKRRRPGQPRARKHGGYKFPQLKRPRRQLQTPPVELHVGSEFLS